eukprot:1161232-Pelagomonas_calceolata.AAC.6
MLEVLDNPAPLLLLRKCLRAVTIGACCQSSPQLWAVKFASGNSLQYGPFWFGPAIVEQGVGAVNLDAHTVHCGVKKKLSGVAQNPWRGWACGHGALGFLGFFRGALQAILSFKDQ